MGEFVGGKPEKIGWRSSATSRTASDQDSTSQWWLSEEEQRMWAVTEGSVLELGAGL